MSTPLKCRACGSDELLDKGDVLQCKFCRHKVAKPKSNEEDLNRADHFRRVSMDFDEAIAIYDDIIRKFPDESEAYWGRLLCRYGIQYSDDSNEDGPPKYVPTCRRMNKTEIFEDVDFASACRHASDELKQYYRREATLIDEIQKKILKILNTEPPYDVFISFKETDPNGKATEDKDIGYKIRDYLTNSKNLRVFFSPISLKSKITSEYEPYIYAALTSAPVMILLGTKPEYIQAEWVKNEWSRYLAMAAEAEREGKPPKNLIIALQGMAPEELPRQLSCKQCLNLAETGNDNELYRIVESNCIRHKEMLREAEERERAKSQQAREEQRRAEEALQKRLRQEEANARSREFAEQMCNRGYELLKNSDFDMANVYFKKALDNNKALALAHWGKILASHRKSSDEDLASTPINFLYESSYREALRYASEEEEARFKKVAELCQNNANYQDEVKRLKKNYESNFESKRIPFDEKADKLYDAYFEAQKQQSYRKADAKTLSKNYFPVPSFIWLLLVEAVLFLVSTFFISYQLKTDALSNSQSLLFVLLPSVLMFFVFSFGFLIRIFPKGKRGFPGFLLTIGSLVAWYQCFTDYATYLQENSTQLPLTIGFGVIGLVFIVILIPLIKRSKNSAAIRAVNREISIKDSTMRNIKLQIEQRSIEQMRELNELYSEKNGKPISRYESENIIVTQALQEKSKSISLGDV